MSGSSGATGATSGGVGNKAGKPTNGRAPVTAPVTPLGAVPTNGRPAAAPPMSVFDKSSGAYDAALGALGGAGASSGYTAALANPGSYGPVAGAGVTTARGPSETPGGITSYLNPFTDQVVNTSLADIEQQRQRALVQDGSAAGASGAFGGSRHGVVEALTNEAALGESARTSAGLRSAGWESAVANSQQNEFFNAGAANNAATAFADALNRRAETEYSGGLTTELANAGALNDASKDKFTQSLLLSDSLSKMAGQGFDFGQALLGNQGASGAQQQSLIQSILSSGSGMVDKFMSSPEEVLNLRLASLGVNPGINTGTQNSTTTTSGGSPLGGVLGMFGQAAGAAKGGK